ncbi:maleylpyruvate isomerase family mycothiol-dependent enzyme [Salsipaludibacter albus]|uniref:maleylpyruvate isomerase family mycothiol-dependent enzyme n=1 Tax=Salsipaludibacter albus TaxID=2849650 RepID=UPI001EE465D4|nr:maleylpyruvate isomerase family mycothiol-dependent enzyme [Salsipaludibacter albus]MBY5163115.1 maleylpyruvate isomerase family mycothiol-dependent enzyme [Salsipaludibacter albus]
MSPTTTGAIRIDRRQARGLAQDEFDRFAALAVSLTPQEWANDTACPGWDVRRMVLHVLGSADAQASPLVFLHQLRRGLALNKEIDAHHWVDGLNEFQIRERSELSNAEVVAQLAAVGGKAVEGRFGTPLPLRYTPVPFGAPIGWKPVNYLLEVGFTRDVWAHRIDIHAAIGRPMDLHIDHDGRLVADIVREWAALHEEPFDMHLTGTAGGTFSQGTGGEHVEMDALEFVRTLCGRLPGTGVMRHPLPL